MLNETYDKLKVSEKDRLQIVLISLDSERDSVEELANYMPYFNLDLLELQEINTTLKDSQVKLILLITESIWMTVTIR